MAFASPAGGERLKPPHDIGRTLIVEPVKTGLLLFHAVAFPAAVSGKRDSAGPGGGCKGMLRLTEPHRGGPSPGSGGPLTGSAHGSQVVS